MVFYTAGELADFCGVKADRIHYLVRTGRLQKGKRVQKDCYVWTADEARQVANWLRLRERLTFQP
jgi:DNA-binding transcriptional MerR regulator